MNICDQLCILFVELIPVKPAQEVTYIKRSPFMYTLHVGENLHF
jgi:hypothetical protein